MIIMKTPISLISALFLIPVASSATVILHGPEDYVVGHWTVTHVDTIASSELNGTDDLFIEYSVTNPFASNNGDGWLTVTLNVDADFGSFINSGVAGLLTRTSTEPGDHQLFDSGVHKGSDAAGAFTVGDGASHAVRITISGFSGSNNFTGEYDVLFEVDHYATSFSAADASISHTVDFGDADVGMNLHLQSAAAAGLGHNVDNFTVYQAVPEPSATALIGLGGLALLMRRSK